MRVHVREHSADIAGLALAAERHLGAPEFQEGAPRRIPRRSRRQKVPPRDRQRCVDRRHDASRDGDATYEHKIDLKIAEVIDEVTRT